jgi:gliding motility-associated-like protein
MDQNVKRRLIEKEDALKEDNIPNIFTPGALKNSKYKLKDLDNNGGSVKLFSSFEFKVYDRWGNMIFNSYEETFEWDGNDAKGQPVMNGIYTFLMKYSTIQKPLELQIKKGTILLER